jgi:prepilin-type N-terminal cleavage/methylation domain-containing protein
MLRGRGSRAGLSLVELLVVMAIFVVVLAALGGLFASSTRAYVVTSERSEALQDAEAVIQLIRYELALAGYRGVGVDYDRAFTLDGAADETVRVERGDDSDVLTVRYFEDRYLGGGDTGERRVSFRVDPETETLVREERRTVGGTVTTELLVGNISDLRVTELVGPDRSRVDVGEVIAGTAVEPDSLAGLIVVVDFSDGRVWEFMVGLGNPQVFEVSAL